MGNRVMISNELGMRMVVSTLFVALVSACNSFRNAVIVNVATPSSSVVTKAFRHLSAQAVIEAFVQAGLEVGDYKTDEPRYWYIGSLDLVDHYIMFFVPSLGEGAGGLVMEFPDVESRDEIFQLHEDKGWYGGIQFWPYVARRDNILLQMNGPLAGDLAGQYIAALKALAK